LRKLLLPNEGFNGLWQAKVWARFEHPSLEGLPALFPIAYWGTAQNPDQALNDCRFLAKSGARQRQIIPLGSPEVLVSRLTVG
jgi:hypothetical protein